MVETIDYWKMWSPYWSYEEDFFLDLEAINKLTVAIRDPVLIIGAGQGLLVQHLKDKGFKTDGVDLDPHMVMYAKKRRGLHLIEANANNMPFPNMSYKTSVIATGVVDFLDDEDQIRLIINEAFRVTDNSGKVFVAFYKYHPRVEKLLRNTGLITDEGSHRLRRMYEMMKLSIESPMKVVSIIKEEANVGFLRALLILLRAQVFEPKKERKATKRWAKLWEQASKELDNPELLIESAPELIPYRNEGDIRGLFRKLNFQIHNMLIYDSCTVVQL